MEFSDEKHNNCKEPNGKVVETTLTGDIECDAYDYEYECGAIYHHNYMDVLGSRDHDCFWDCSQCKKGKNNG